jgi:lipopolysaccharide transport system permease protein
MERMEPAVARPAEPSTASRLLRQRLGRLLDVLFVLTQSDMRFRYGRGPVLVVRWLFDPFALVGVYLILLVVVLDRPGRAPGLSIAAAVVPFQLVMSSVVNAIGALGVRRPIVLNMAFPRSLLPLSSVFTETASFLASFALIAVMMAIYSVPPTLAVLWTPVAVVVNMALAAGFAYPASLFGIWFRELWSFGVSFVRTLFFLGPGLVPLSQTGGTASNLLKLNPLTGLFEAYRDIFYYGRSPKAWELLYPLACALVLLVVFCPIYRREQRHFAKVAD